ncbi:MAG TPA: GNAT family N-acetyltransferase [Actinomycetota bacterium]
MRADTSSKAPRRTFTTRDGRSGLVRPAQRSDAAACVAIVKEATTMRPRTIMTMTDEVWGVREWRKRMLGQGDRGISLVAEVDGRVVGLLGAVRGDRPVTSHGAEFGITVAAAYRGGGVGRAMLEALEDWARAHGVWRLVLGVFESNEGARGLYESLGYEAEGVERRVVAFPDGTVDVLRMSKFLR